MQNRALNFCISCLVFVLVACSVYANFKMTLNDPDTGWHLAAGDLIRLSGSIPKTDPWAFTSAGTPWINLAWMWDVWMSFLHTHMGWHGMIAFFALCCGLTMALLYLACVLRTKSSMASFLVICLVIISIPIHLRSMWVSNLFLAIIFLLAMLIQYRNWNIKWWYVMPALMPLWVNVHGGFITAFLIVGAYGLQALLARQWRTALHLCAVGLLSIAALGIGPYGYNGVFTVLYKTFTTPALGFIGEFQPSILSWSYLVTRLYIPIFFICAIHKKARVTLAEGILGFGLIPMAITSERYWTFVYIFSCPILAQYFTQYMHDNKDRGSKTAKRYAAALHDWLWIRHGIAAMLCTTAAIAIAIALVFSPPIARMTQLGNFEPYDVFQPAINFISTHYPSRRFLTDYTSGGFLIAQGKGSVPVFIDGRGETAYPRELVQDYIDFAKGKRGWERIFDRYQLDGLILINLYDPYELSQRFGERRGFKRVFRDQAVEIYMLEK